MTRLRIAFLSSLDSTSRRAFSGTLYFMSQALEKHCGSVVHLGPAHSRIAAADERINRVVRPLFGREVLYGQSLAAAREYRLIFEKRLREDEPFDLIFAPAASTQIAMLNTTIPILYASDATFALTRDRLHSYKRISSASASAANDIEQRAITKAAAATYPSRWAADSALNDYGANPDCVSVVPWGANMDRIPAADKIWPSKSGEGCSLIFLGVHWELKGGPIAYAATELLRQRGVNATLTVCGSVPPNGLNAEWLKVIPLLNKQNPVEEQRLSDLLLHSNFLILPTRFDCFGIAFCEASAHGTPSLGSDTGGVGGAIADGKSGYLLPLTAGPQAYADLIQAIWSDRERYRKLVATSRQHYEEQVNWDSWGVEMRKIVASLMS